MSAAFRMIRAGTGASLVACLPFSVAFAQEPAGAAAPGEGLALQEVTVTAERREEKLQDVPIAVAAIDGATLTSRGIPSLLNLQFSVPGLVIGNLSGYANPFLRGVGGDIISPQADQGVPTYIDGVYSANNISNLTNLMGVQQMEVLYGPQGTLFGRNAVGGAINITTLSPTDQFRSSATLGFGNYASKELSGYISGPVTSKLLVGVYAAGTQRNPYLTYVGPQPVEAAPQYEQQAAVRVKAIYEATDSLRLTGSLDYQTMQSRESNSYRQIQANALGFALGAPLIIEPYVLAIDGPDFIKMHSYRASLKAEQDFSWSRLVAIGSYTKTYNETQGDVDGTQAPAIDDAGNLLGGNRNSTIELQLQSLASSRIKWIGGLYGFKEHSGYDPLHLNLGPAVTPAPESDFDTGLQNTVSAAVFGQATIPITDALHLTLGGRYTWDRARFSGFSSKAYTMPGSLDPYPGPPFYFISYPRQTAQWKQFTPKVSVDYKIDDTLLYATYSKGFKAGTFNINSPSSPGPVNPEILTSYEVGSKSDFFDGRVRLNGAAYLYNYKDLQVTSVLNSGNTKLENAAKARIYGLDLSPSVLIMSGLIFSAGLEYNHSRYTDFPHFAGELPAAVGNMPADIDATGHQLSHAPKWTTNASLDYTRPIGSMGNVHGTVNWYRNGGFYWDAQNVLKQDAYDVLNVTVAFSTPDDNWTFALWGSNLTNTFYETAALAFGPGTVAFDAPPRMFGAKLTHAIH